MIVVLVVYWFVGVLVVVVWVLGVLVVVVCLMYSCVGVICVYGCYYFGVFVLRDLVYWLVVLVLFTGSVLTVVCWFGFAVGGWLLD